MKGSAPCSFNPLINARTATSILATPRLPTPTAILAPGFTLALISGRSSSSVTAFATSSRPCRSKTCRTFAISGRSNPRPPAILNCRSSRTILPFPLLWACSKPQKQHLIRIPYHNHSTPYKSSGPVCGNITYCRKALKHLTPCLFR